MVAQALRFHQQGLLAQAEAEYKKVLQLDGKNPAVWGNLGALYCQAGQFEPGVSCLRQSLAAQPGQPDTLNNLGNALKALGRYDEALGAYDQAIQLHPKHAAAHNNRGVLLNELGRHEEALSSCERAVQIKSDYADAHNNLGNALLGLRRHEEALRSYARALALNPRHAGAYNNQGNALARSGRLDQAVTSYEQALAIDPLYANAHSNLGNALKELGRPQDALVQYDKALAIHPRHAETHFNKGSVLKEAKRYEDALLSFDQAIAAKPDYAEAHNSRGDVLACLKRYDQALSSFDQALRLRADLAGAHNNRGAVLRLLRRYDEALASFDQALRLQPDYAEARWNKALLDLALGRYEEGWALFEWRWRIADFKPGLRHFTQALWLGDAALAGKTILLWAEQGLGDALQFCRYAAQVKALGARVVVEVAPPLVAVVSTLDPELQVVPAGQPLPDFDLQCPLMSLPHALKTTLEHMPPAGAYLHAEAAKVLQWRDRLGPRDKPRVGLVWSGSIHHKNDSSRSIALRELAPLLGEPYEFHSLQIEYRADDAACLQETPAVIRHEADLHDFSDTAALLANLDIVVCVDTSVAHLAAAMGRPTLVLLAYESDYRWLLDRSDSPWYDSVHLLRQTQSGQWAPVIAQAREELARRLA